MNYIELSELAEGQKYTEPVFIEEDMLLVPAGIPVRKKDLSLLASLGITRVMTTGKILTGELASPEAFSVRPAEPSADKPAVSAPPVSSAKSPAARSETAAPENGEEAYRKLSMLIKQLDHIFKEIALHIPLTNRSQNTVSLRQLWAISAALLQLIKEQKNSCLNFILGNTLKGCELAKSAVNTAILSILMARELKFDLQRIPEVAAAALLHDIGMLRLPPELAAKQGSLTPEEISFIQLHTTHSYQIITRELAYSQAVGVIALQHHERWDGTGYPQRCTGNEIDPGARIVCVADAFEAMVSEKPYRDSMIGYFAMKTMVSENAAHFAPNILKTFVKIMGMYPIGSGVTLNDGRIARVVNVNPEVPLRPSIQIIAESGAQRVENGALIELIKHKNLFITQALDISGL